MLVQMATTLKPFRFTFLLLLFATTYLTAEWMMRTQKEVTTGNILQMINELSVTSCSLICKRDRKCKSFGTKKDLKFGGLGTCYLLSSDSEIGHQGGLVTSLFVTKVVSCETIYLLFCEKLYTQLFNMKKSVSALISQSSLKFSSKFL